MWGITLGVGGAIAALGAPVLGAVADQAGRRKMWIGGFTVLSVTATALLWFIKPDEAYQWWGLAFVLLGALGMEAGLLFYNAMLPALVPQDHIGRWSGWGWGLGYAGGLACLTLALVAFVNEPNAWFSFDTESALHIRSAFLLAALWFALFSLPLFLFTPDTPASGKSATRILRDGLHQLRESLRNIRRYRNIVRFLIARLFYTDGLVTLFLFGGVYAAGVFEMTEQQILGFGIALNAAAGAGAAAFSWLDDLIGSKRTILLALLGLILPCFFLLVTDSQTGFWTGGIVLGIFVGPVQAASRSMMARMAPAELRCQMFGLYALSGKATAFVGPLVVGSTTYLTGSQRIGMSAIVVLLTVGFLLLLGVPEPTKPIPRS